MLGAYFECGRLRRRLERAPFTGSESRVRRSPTPGANEESA